MEINGHPTQDLIDELQKRGSLLYRGTAIGPDAEALLLAASTHDETPGYWLFIPPQAYETEIDEPPTFR